ncbi:hypothetical protein ACFVDQ_31210 [Streptomyces sp. NPDC057684]|uniref:hypothetical protein n=1 Tax=unclassified Streptomyces TaxID=2593676 RepID=UPI0036B76E64
MDAVEPSGLTEWYGDVVDVGSPQRWGGRDELLVPPSGVVGVPSGRVESAAADVILDGAAAVAADVDHTGAGDPLHHAYITTTAATFAGIVPFPFLFWDTDEPRRWVRRADHRTKS